MKLCAHLIRMRRPIPREFGHRLLQVLAMLSGSFLRSMVFLASLREINRYFLRSKTLSASVPDRRLFTSRAREGSSSAVFALPY